MKFFFYTVHVILVAYQDGECPHYRGIHYLW